MIGFYDYTVFLTYLSLLSGTFGIIFCLDGIGHPYLGMFCLMLSGLCDAFDGKVARTKKGRTDQQRRFGIQIDSLSDLVAFGVLPACIGIALMRGGSMAHWPHPALPELRFLGFLADPRVCKGVLTAIALFYVLMAMIRLAFFNVMEEERQQAAGGEVLRSYVGLPVTSAALIFPSIMLLHIFSHADLTILYFAVLFLVGFLFVSEIRVGKPRTRGIVVMVAAGAVEAALLAAVFLSFVHR